MALLKSKDQLIKIKLHYVEKDVDGYNKAIPLSDEKAKELLADEKMKESVKIFTTFWKEMSHGENNSITKASLSSGPDSNPGELDYIKFRDIKIKNCLKRWDLKDDEGNDVPVNNENINALPWDIIKAVFDRYEQKSSVSENEIKN